MYLQSNGSDRKKITADQSQAHLLWMNVSLCLILKYILLRQTLYRGIMMFILKAYFQQTTIRLL